ncbi:MAG: hypothetical protein V1847_04760 [Candidatus Diapherotrites archaeon]
MKPFQKFLSRITLFRKKPDALAGPFLQFRILARRKKWPEVEKLAQELLESKDAQLKFRSMIESLMDEPQNKLNTRLFEIVSRYRNLAEAREIFQEQSFDGLLVHGQEAFGKKTFPFALTLYEEAFRQAQAEGLSRMRFTAYEHGMACLQTMADKAAQKNDYRSAVDHLLARTVWAEQVVGKKEAAQQLINKAFHYANFSKDKKLQRKVALRWKELEND